VSTTWVHFTSLSWEETAVWARAGGGATAGEVGVATGHGRGEVYGVGPWLRAQVAIVVVRKLSTAAEAATAVGREDG
jgi:hypothetical protein